MQCGPCYEYFRALKRNSIAANFTQSKTHKSIIILATEQRREEDFNMKYNYKKKYLTSTEFQADSTIIPANSFTNFSYIERFSKHLQIISFRPRKNRNNKILPPLGNFRAAEFFFFLKFFVFSSKILENFKKLEISDLIINFLPSLGVNRATV